MANEPLSREEALALAQRWRENVVEQTPALTPYGKEIVDRLMADLLQRVVRVKCAEAKEEEAIGWRITVATLQKELAEANIKPAPMTKCTCEPPSSSRPSICAVHCHCMLNGKSLYDPMIDGRCRRCKNYPRYLYNPAESAPEKTQGK
jgi:hypothetical protein